MRGEGFCREAVVMGGATCFLTGRRGVPAGETGCGGQEAAAGEGRDCSGRGRATATCMLAEGSGVEWLLGAGGGGLGGRQLVELVVGRDGSVRVQDVQVQGLRVVG